MSGPTFSTVAVYDSHSRLLWDKRRSDTENVQHLAFYIADLEREIHYGEVARVVAIYLKWKKLWRILTLRRYFKSDKGGIVNP